MRIEIKETEKEILNVYYYLLISNYFLLAEWYQYKFPRNSSFLWHWNHGRTFSDAIYPGNLHRSSSSVSLEEFLTYITNNTFFSALFIVQFGDFFLFWKSQ